MENIIQGHKDFVRSQIEKSFGVENDIEKAHNVGDVHPNDKWVWTEYAPGKFDWRNKKKEDGKSVGRYVTLDSRSSWDDIWDEAKKACEKWYDSLDDKEGKDKKQWVQEKTRGICQNYKSGVSKISVIGAINGVYQGIERQEAKRKDDDKSETKKNHEDNHVLKMNTTSDVADYLANKYGVKPIYRKNVDSFENFNEHGAKIRVTSVYEVKISNELKVQIGRVVYCTKDWMKKIIKPNEIITRTATPELDKNGKIHFQWHKNALKSIPLGSNQDSYSYIETRGFPDF